MTSLRRCGALVATLLGCSRAGPVEAHPDAPGAPAESPPAASALSTPSSSPLVERGDSTEAREIRERLVRQIETLERPWEGGDWDPRVIDAMRRVPRHLFMPAVSLETAYQDEPFPIGHGQTISQPTVVALMTNALALSGREVVLEIGTGSGYQAAILSLLCREVYSIELIAPLGRAAEQRLGALGYRNVHVRIGDGYAGWPERAPFDRIVLTAAPSTMPRALLGQLRDGGIVVAPLGDDHQRLVRWTKRGATVVKQDLGGVRFVPMLPGSSR